MASKKKAVSQKRFKVSGGYVIYDMTFKTYWTKFSSEAKARKALAQWRKMNPDRRFKIVKVKATSVDWTRASSRQLARVMKNGTPLEKKAAKRELSRRQRGYRSLLGGYID